MSIEDEKKLEELKQLNKDFMHVFALPEGKRVLEYLEKTYFIRSTTMRVDDPYGVVYSEGQRTVVLDIHRLMNPKFDEFIEKVREANSE